MPGGGGTPDLYQPSPPRTLILHPQLKFTQKGLPSMKHIACLALISISSALSAQMAHGPTAAPTYAGPAAEVTTSYSRLKANVIKAAEKMPAEDYQFKGTPEIRTYARVVNHVTEAQSHSCSTLAGSKFDPAMVPADTADKATIVASLKASYDLCDKAYATLTDTNITEAVQAGPAKRSRVSMAWGVVSHDNEQYAILSLYLRLKGLVPPTSEK